VTGRRRPDSERAKASRQCESKDVLIVREILTCNAIVESHLSRREASEDMNVRMFEDAR
jgi:hypothetical protein